MDINNSITSSENSDLRAQNGAVADEHSTNSVIKRSYFQELERGPAKVPPKLTESFNLEESLSKAVEKAVNFANRVLLDDDMTMSLQENQEDENKVIVTNVENEQVVQEYNPVQVLQMYSSNYNLQGIIVDALI